MAGDSACVMKWEMC